MNTSPFNHHQQTLINCCLNTIAHIIPVSAAVYYLVNEEWQPEHHILYGITPDMYQVYLESFTQSDPLHPKNFINNEQRLVSMNDNMKESGQAFYHDFMQSNKLTDRVEIFIRRGSKILSGLSVLRDYPFRHQEIMRLNTIIPVAELMTFDILPDSQIAFTAKEQEIIQLVREGASNKRIALQLRISLSTVKTHLRNIFAKAKVTNRTELVSSGFISRNLSGYGTAPAEIINNSCRGGNPMS
ncbi:response regulator transcription factor [Xenorhabdus innexi]|uniref:Monoamine regulon transcriptional regulator n=1 Tax=Xenorhabdus innexi TaxID=290109 RepID=A0A1N6MU22_9GAMM|nr:helix-turn-helix transcriptional regulator [Xenorhabdus innexi]PHM31057.1 putative regulatory protein [Xenorhabdus innexi]SIP72310.1 Monoamine regulon transcriptional regulator [Xenorhabdus innexi]